MGTSTRTSSPRCSNEEGMHDTLWQAVLGEIEVSVSKASYATWFKKTCLLRHKDNRIVIGVPNVFIKQQLEMRYNKLIADALANNGLKPDEIEYKIHTDGLSRRTAASIIDDETIILSNHNLQPNNSPAHHPATSVTHAYRQQSLNEKYTFESFIVGSGNELAYAACQAIAANPGTKYNPLFLYGGVGIGKTHLIQAVGNAVLAHNPNAKVVYVSTEQFVQEFIDAVRYKKNTDFAGYYRSADVLILDDIQFIASKEKTQEEFFHTFNALHQANKQIIISSDKPPKDIPTLEERLRSRFTWGMAIDMQTPDFETRCAIILSKAHTSEHELSAEVVEYLASQVQTNIRELEGVLNQFLAWCEVQHREPDLAAIKTLFSTAIQQRPKHITPRHIVERTARYFQIPMEDLLGPKRDKDIVTPRQIAMYLLRSELHLSFPKIATELGRKDHTTAIHSIAKITQESRTMSGMQEHIQAIKEKLYA